MPITPLVKTFAPQMANIVRKLCAYTTKYQHQISLAINAVVSDPLDKAALLAFLNSVVSTCAIVNKYWPPEQP